MPTTDLSCPEPFLDSKRRSRARRARVRSRLRRLRGRRSAIAVLGASLCLTGGAVAHDGGATSAAAKSSVKGAGVVALQRALGIPADGIYGPQTRRAVKQLPARAWARRRRHRRSADARCARDHRAQQRAARRRRSSGSRSASPAATRPPSRADGRYRGKYQFSRATWRSLGGKGDPAAADEVDPGRDGGEAARPARHHALAELRLAPAERCRRLAHAQHACRGAGDRPRCRRRPSSRRCSSRSRSCRRP